MKISGSLASFESEAEPNSLWGAAPQIWKRYSDSVGTQILTSVLGVCTGILLPRLFGPQGRGDLAVILLWPVALDFIGSLGLYRSIVYFAAKYRQDLSRLVSVCAVLAVAQSALVVAAGLFILPLVLKNYAPPIRNASYAFLFFIPIRQLAILEGQLLLGVLDTKWYNACLALPVMSYALGTAILYLWNRPSVACIVTFQMAGIALAAALGFHVIRRKLNPHWEWHFGTASEVLRYGLKTHAGDITSFLNQRCDQFLISFLLPGPILGLYLAAVSLSEGLLIIPRAISGLTLASGSHCDHSGAWRWAKRSLILSVVILAPAALGLWILSPWLIPRLFGPAFHQSITPFKILVPGASAMAITLVLYGALRSVNRPEIPSYCELLGLCATVVFLALLLKPLGAVGAAIASSAAYTATLAAVLSLLWVGRRRAIAAAEG
jgi:O-antigen/teichoic acid export membrane protein